ncbi:hypothetical protein AALO_G00220680 [Alosa alosa]|uniref:Uncharacterized protein n=1 Tax=Alosa alosa TaxID=278164 RepID=A0AAV6FX74_9TELE|nr:hypothetical protein AALO_G00220680 [Alosa alosa]
MLHDIINIKACALLQKSNSKKFKTNDKCLCICSLHCERPSVHWKNLTCHFHTQKRNNKKSCHCENLSGV